jgi:hypothetical protein
MSDFTDFTAALKEWANRGDWSDALVASFIRSAEEKLNAELRIDRMLQTDDAIISARYAPLPDDWLEMDLVRLMYVSDFYPSGFAPMSYKPRAEFFATGDLDAVGIYTIQGRKIFIGGTPNNTEGQTVRIDYYQEVPVFSDTTPSWVYTKYQSLYRYAALMHADLHALGEEQTSSMLKQLCEDEIQKLNAMHRYSRASGSRLARTRVRSFG